MSLVLTPAETGRRKRGHLVLSDLNEALGSSDSLIVVMYEGISAYISDTSPTMKTMCWEPMLGIQAMGEESRVLRAEAV